MNKRQLKLLTREIVKETINALRKNRMNERASNFESVTGEFTVQVDLVGRPDESVIDVTVEGEWEETGSLGQYDYGDETSTDTSSGKYIVITSYDWDKTGYTPAEIKIVNKAIDTQLEDWAEKLTDRNY